MKIPGKLFTLVVLLCFCMENDAQVIFPVEISSDKHYLVDQANKPFPILGRTAWGIISQPEEGYKKFISNSVAHGCNAIEVSVIIHWPMANHPPFNGHGDAPFVKKLNGEAWDSKLTYKDKRNEAPDLLTPNEKYWDYVDGFLSYCESQGVLVFLFPGYLGYKGEEQGWMQELLANGTGKTTAYGRWVATRFKDKKNIVWMLLGDMGNFTAEEKAAETALIRGLKSVQGQCMQYSAESFSGQNSADNAEFGNEMTLNGSYTWDKKIPVPYIARIAYQHNPVMPSFLLEEPYDEEGPDGNNYNPNATQPVRRFEWWGWLSTIGGYIAGNGYVWPFIDPVWQQHLNTQAAMDMSRLNHFIQSIAWWKLIPSGLHGIKQLIADANNADASTAYVAAAASVDGDLLVAYIPPDHRGPVTVSTHILKVKTFASWFDPTNGKYTVAEPGPVMNTGTHVFTPPAKNSAGDADWVLLLSTKKINE